MFINLKQMTSTVELFPWLIIPKVIVIKLTIMDSYHILQHQFDINNLPAAFSQYWRGAYPMSLRCRACDLPCQILKYIINAVSLIPPPPFSRCWREASPMTWARTPWCRACLPCRGVSLRRPGERWRRSSKLTTTTTTWSTSGYAVAL